MQRSRCFLDKGQATNPSCSTQRAAMIALHEWGAEIRVRRPKPGMTSAQHEKTWLFDDHVFLCGSANATANSFTKCEEAVTATKSPTLIASQVAHFEEIWEDAEEVDWLELEEKEIASLAAKTAKGAARSAHPHWK